MIYLPIWKEKTNHPDRLCIICEFAYQLRKYDDLIDTETDETVQKWVDDVTTMEKLTLSDNEWKKSKYWIEKCKIDLELFELHRRWISISSPDAMNEEKKQFCDEQIEKLNNAALTMTIVSCSDLRKLREAFRVRMRKDNNSDGVEQIKYCIQLLDVLDKIQLVNESNMLTRYAAIIADCYYTLRKITTTEEREEIANRIKQKYQKLIEMSNEIYANELNHPLRIDIIDVFSEFALFKYRNQIGNQCRELVQSLTNMARAQPKGTLTDFEYEDSQWTLERIEYRLGTFK